MVVSSLILGRPGEVCALHRRMPWLALLALLVTAAFATPALASWMVPGLPIRPKDFALLKHDGLYHIFYIRANRDLPDSSEVNFGHAVSKDLWYWTQYPPVVQAGASSWDSSQVWAPSMVERDGVFYMFYTGVCTIPGVLGCWQSIGIATSTDLMEWNRMDAPVYECPDVPWSVCDSALTSNAFRDPFVMPDPAHPGQWLLYYVTFPAADSAGMVVGVAGSDGDFTHWSDLGWLWITNRQYSYSTIVESPHLFEHAGLWYLFFTTNAGQPLTFWTGPDPVGPVGSWTPHGRLSWMLGQDTSTWYASEYFRDGLVDYFAFVQAERITIMRMVWGPDWQFSLAQPDWMHVVRMSWDSVRVAHGDTATLSILAANWAGGSATLDAVRVRSDGTQAPIALDLLGLPTTVPLTGDTTRVAWRAEWLADSTDTSSVLRLLVRVADQTAAAPLLEVPEPPPLRVTALVWDSASVLQGDTTRLSIAAEHWEEHSASLEALRMRGDGSEASLPLDSLGLPATVALTADTTRVSWVAKWLPDSPDTSETLRLLVRLMDRSTAAPPLDVIGPPPLRVTALVWDSTSVLHGDTTRLSIAAEHWERRSANLEGLRVRAESLEVALPLDLLGLPATVALTGDTTTVPWVAKWLPDAPDTGRTLRLLVRLADRSAAAPLLAVIRPPSAPQPAPGPAPPPADEPLKQWHRGARFSLLPRPVAGESAMLIQLDQPAPVRLDIYDAQGRRVRNLVERELPKGATVVLWDGRGASGVAVTPGVYFGRLTTPQGGRTVRLVRLR